MRNQMNQDNEIGNIEAAIEDIIDTVEPTVKKNTKATPGEPAMKQVIVRTTDAEHARWKQAADVLNVSLAEFMRDACSKAASRELDCAHPAQFRKEYPWSSTCTKCGKRLR